MSRTCLIASALCLVTAAAVAQPKEDAAGAPLDRASVSAPALKRQAGVRDRVDLGIVDKLLIGPSKLEEVLDDRLPSLAITSKLEAARLNDIQRKKRDPKFHGIIDSLKIGKIEISLERRQVRTDRGLRSLLLTRQGSDYVYDGDLIVPPFAIGGVGFPEPGSSQPPGLTFAAGPTGTFGEGALWDDAIVPFEIADDFCCEEELTQAIADYEARTVFRFEPRDGQHTYIRFINSEPLLSSRTQLGKQHGSNEIRIQAFRSDGSDAQGLVGTIQHEIAHELGLIHEHLRSDRDEFIVRNPSCAPEGIFESIVEGWIDMTNVAFTEDDAELLTDYDFASRMHYGFDLDENGDGAVDCSTWVRKESCDDPSNDSCLANFSSALLSAGDIEGLHKLYIAVPGANQFLTEPDQVRTFTGDNVRHRGRRIDRCLHGTHFGQSACSASARGRVADEFCIAKGFQDGFNVQYEGITGEHSGFHQTLGWINAWGLDVISSISCQNLSDTQEEVVGGTLEEETFSGSEASVSDRRIDRCMHGGGVAGDRCSQANQRRIADAFCELEGFDASSAFETDFGPNAFMSGFFPEDDEFKDVAGIDHFTEISCVRTP